MKPEVQAALTQAAEIRKSILKGISVERRIELLESLFVDFFYNEWQTLLKWSALTGQSAQIDTGYIAQHVASLVLEVPGQGFKGKGLDLVDNTEVKAAAIVSGVDRPRWNHNLGTLEQDEERWSKHLPTVGEEYLAVPNIFYLLFDRVANGATTPRVLRVRAWCVDAQRDHAWRELVQRFLDSRRGKKYNFQLHPPVGYDDSIAVNTLGNLDLAEVLVLDARLHGVAGGPEPFQIEWVRKPSAEVRPVTGRCTAQAYGGRGARPSRLNTAEDMLPDLDLIRDLLPGTDPEEIVRALAQELQVAGEDLTDED